MYRLWASLRLGHLREWVEGWSPHSVFSLGTGPSSVEAARKNFLLEREIASTRMIVPNWTHCLEFEFQLRKEALRLTREEGQSIWRALWAAYRDPHRRIEHWLTLLTIANSGGSTTTTKTSSSSSSSNPADHRLQRNEKKSPNSRKLCKGDVLRE